MNYILESTLRHMCLVKIATQLWNQDDFPIEDGIPGDHSPAPVANVLEKVEQLGFPNRLKSELSLMLKPMESEIINWFCHLFNRYAILRNDPRELRWTSLGTIDGGKSVEIILTTSDHSLSLDRRFELACDFCLVDQIAILRAQLSPEKQHRYRYYSILRPYYVTDDLAEQREMMAAEGRRPTGEAFYYHAFISALYENNAVAAKYFYLKLSPEQIHEWVFSYDRSQLYSVDPFGAELVCFMLSRMDQNLRLELLTGHSPFLAVDWVLPRLLEWPYQGFFLETVQELWDFISERHFMSLLQNVCTRIDEDCQNCTFRMILRRFWQSSPTAYKKRIVNDWTSAWEVLHCFFEYGEVELCAAVLNEANAAEKERLVSVENVSLRLRRSARLTDKSACAFLKFLLVECGTSEEKIGQFKAYFVSSDLDITMNDDEKKNMLQFLENFSSG